MQKLRWPKLVALGNRKAKRELERRGRDPVTGKKKPPVTGKKKPPVTEHELLRRNRDPAKGQKKPPVTKQQVSRRGRDLGKRFTCFECETRFYQLGNPTPLCPGCGADQRDF